MAMNSVRMRSVLCQMTPEMIEALDDLVEKKLFPSRNEAIRLACRDMILEHRKLCIEIKRLHLTEIIEEINLM